MSGGKEEKIRIISQGSILVRSLVRIRIIRWAVIVILEGAPVSDAIARTRSGFFIRCVFFNVK
jgi:hypothetical protein